MNLLNEREKTHGDYNEVARVAQDLKESLRHQDGLSDPDCYKLPCVHSESLDLICTKMARIVCGDHNELDHWRDIIGYAQLVINHITVPSGSSTKEPPDEPKDPSIGDDWDYDPYYRPRSGLPR